MKKKVKAKKENSERWLLTYADMITLLLALFILLYAMSNIDQTKYEQLATSLRGALGNSSNVIEGDEGIIQDGGGKTPMDISGGGTEEISPTPKAQATEESANDKTLETEQDMNNLKDGIREAIEDTKVKDAVGTSVAEWGLTISLANDAFFDSGNAKLKEDMKKGLGRIAKLLNKINNKIIVEGYTDNVPVGEGNEFSSNWQLSAARAANVAEYLVDVEKVEGTRLSAIGYGEYRPFASNATAQGRQKNRRVDITILYDSATGMIFK